METPPKNKGGRPPGSLSKLSQKLIAEAEEGGEMPHEFLLRVARGKPIEQAICNELGVVIKHTYVIPDMEARRDAAKAAAPYFAPKLSTIETIGGLSDYQLDEIIERLATETGISFGAGGEGEANQVPASYRERRSARGTDTPTTH